MKDLKTRLVPLHYSVPPHIAAWLEDVAAREDRKVGDLVRKILKKAYEAEHPPTNGTHEPKQQGARARA